MLTLERYPTADLLKLLANILTHIAQSNDHSALLVSLPPPPASPTSPTFSLSSAARTVLVPTTTHAPLTFHARNVPTISLEAYLLRILKYCPTSNYVFLSLLVYFDRMAALSSASGSPPAAGKTSFHVDSYNVHRLVIAGVTVASKFFSDVFYTNSRYAKVGGLPLPELNQLELQFLLMNDFRLVISPQQMRLYSQHLITFSLDHPPPSMGRIDISVLAATLGFNPQTTFPAPSPPSYPPPPPLVVLPPSTAAAPTSTHSSSSSPHCPPSSPPLRPSTSPSPSPSNSSSSSLRSSPSPSPRPPRTVITNGHLPISHHPRHPPTRVHEESDSDDDDSSDDDGDSDKGDAETLTSTSTDDDSEPTIRGPRTVVGWDPDGARKSP